MRRTFTVLAVAVLVAALFATPGLATAKGGNGGGNGGGSHRGGNGGTWFNLLGTIQAVNAGARTITVQVTTPENLLKYNPITVKTTSATKFKECEDGVSTGIYFTDLKTGSQVRVKGTVNDGVFVATTVIQYVP